jgi:hypothetical protein
MKKMRRKMARIRRLRAMMVDGEGGVFVAHIMTKPLSIDPN